MVGVRGCGAIDGHFEKNGYDGFAGEIGGVFVGEGDDLFAGAAVLETMR